MPRQRIALIFLVHVWVYHYTHTMRIAILAKRSMSYYFYKDTVYKKHFRVSNSDKYKTHIKSTCKRLSKCLMTYEILHFLNCMTGAFAKCNMVGLATHALTFLVKYILHVVTTYLSIEK